MQDHSDLEIFAREHGLKIGTIADLIQHRSHNESMIERVGTRRLTTAQGTFDCIVYRDRTGGAHLALSVGQWQPEDEVLVRVHEPLSLIDLLDAAGTRHSWPLPSALAALQAGGRGVAVLLNCGDDAEGLLTRALAPQGGPSLRNSGSIDLRTYGIGSQILRDVGVRRMRLLGKARRMPSMTGFGLEVTGFTAAPSTKD